MKRTTVVPAYGRDYKNANAAKHDWLANKDFIVCDISDPDDGRYVNREQVPDREIWVRYNQLTRIVQVQ